MKTFLGQLFCRHVWRCYLVEEGDWLTKIMECQQCRKVKVIQERNE